MKISRTEAKNITPSSKDAASFLGGNLQAPSFESRKESTIVITVEGQVNKPRAVIIGSEEEDIQVKARPVTTRKDPVHQSGTLKGSLRLSETIHSKEHEAEVKQSEKSFEERKFEILYAIFLVVSVFLIYLAMSPTRRV